MNVAQIEQLHAFMHADTFFDVWVHDKDGWTRLEATMGRGATRDGCIALVLDCDDIGTIRVIKNNWHAAPHDCTEEIAASIADLLARKGFDEDEILCFKIVSAHLPRTDVWEIVRHHGIAVAAE